MMRTCTQCQHSFEITDRDRVFYERIQVPEPTHCPDCRNQRRMAWRNDRTFYHRKCDLSGKQMISIYPAQTPFPVYHQEEWYSDKWDPMNFGQDVDFSRPFFEQFQELMMKVPRLGIDLVNCENSDYCNYCGDDKNCYLDIAGEDNEDCYFDLFTKHSKNVVDSTFVYRSQWCYECIQCYDSFQLQYCMYCDNCSDCFFCFDMKGCRDCLFSTGLRNKQYYILNQPYSKADYEQKKAELQLGSWQAVLEYKKKWIDLIREANHRDMVLLNCENSVGNNLKNCKNVFYSFNASNCEDSSYLYDVLDAKDCADLNYSLYKPELSYELISTLNMVNSAFSMASHYNSEVYYCDLTNNSQSLFGCIGLERKQYCILNKQYSKEDYDALLPQMIEHMKSTKEWGEFFPVAISPFGYNETVAQEYFPLTEQEVNDREWTWSHVEDQNSYQGPAVELPDDIGQATDDVLGKIYFCEHSGKPYKIIQQELAFYQRMAIALPRRSPHQRHLDRNALRSSRRLHERRCSQCEKPVQSTFAPERTELIFCQECYLMRIH